jgi:hypothetical protein
MGGSDDYPYREADYHPDAKYQAGTADESKRESDSDCDAKSEHDAVISG